MCNSKIFVIWLSAGVAAVVTSVTATAQAQTGLESNCSQSPAGDSAQMVLSITPTWNSPQTHIQNFEKLPHGGWKRRGGVYDGVVGKNGLGWGVGEDNDSTQTNGVKKYEVDNRAPAGVFRLRGSFGEHSIDELMADPKIGFQRQSGIPYRQADDNSQCVDWELDPETYNHLLFDVRTELPRGATSERLLRDDNLYEYAIVVDHNRINQSHRDEIFDQAQGIRRRGSCIFLHVWKSENEVNFPANLKATAGCTAFRKDKIQTLMSWLEARKKPILVQLPLDEYLDKKEQWCLPDLDRRVTDQIRAEGGLEGIKALGEAIKGLEALTPPEAPCTN